MTQRIDTHHHILPPRYLAQERERIQEVSHSLFPQLLEWTPGRALEAMDQSGIATDHLDLHARSLVWRCRGRPPARPGVQ